MTKQIWAITTCRVSTPEQMANNSLGRQAEATLRSAEELDAYIPDDGQWSGSVSSKAGTNVDRKDIKQMIDYCRKHPQVKYLIVHEVDRFMRSIDELFHFEVVFRQLGVKVWYASQPELNTDDVHAKLLKALEAFKGEGSNVERQKKSIDGDITALKEGRYPLGYMKGVLAGIQEVHPVRGPALKAVLVRLVTKLVTPSQGLVELNESEFMNGHAPYKMDKFRKIVTDPFYAGIVEVNKQVKVRNENGLHEPLITKAQHYELLKIMDGKKKTQLGPRKNGNPEFPCNNLTTCDRCLTRPNGRYVGFNHGNGKPNSTLVYQKYRCRACNRYITRDALHAGVAQQFKENPISSYASERLIAALKIVWQRREGDAEQEVSRIKHRVSALREAIGQQVEAATDPMNIVIKSEIMAAIEQKKDEITKLEEDLERLLDRKENDQEQFLRYAYALIENTGDKFLDPLTSQEHRLRCKQIIFPAGFHIDADNKVYTPEKSPLITLLPKKKSTEVLLNSQLVRVRGL